MSGHWKRFKVDESDESFLETRLVKFSVGRNGTRIELVCENDIILQIIFEKWTLSYRITDKKCRLRTPTYLSEKYGKEVLGDYPFFIVEDSNYLKWFHHESSNIHENYGNHHVSHYVFVTSNYVIDILSSYPPEVKEIESDEKWMNQEEVNAK